MQTDPKRRDILKVLGALGLSLAVPGCGTARSSRMGDPRPPGAPPLLIIGAGIAGMTAGYLFKQRGIDFRIIEAASTYGGRIKHTRDFVDFPIPLGAEWIHVDRDILETIVNDAEVQIQTRLTGYDPTDEAGEFDGKLTLEPVGENADLKFIGSGWLDFFETYILPDIQAHIVYGTPIERIEYGDDGVRLTAQDGRTWESDAAIVTVPLKMLQTGAITFVPPLPGDHQEAIEAANIWGGMKAFFEFDAAFYPTFLYAPDSETAAGQRMYYDAAYGQASKKHVLGLFAVGAQARPYQAFSSDPDGLRDHVLAELDAVFDGAASRHYLRHISQDWNAEPFIGAAYLADNADSWIPAALAEPVADRLFFAGEAYSNRGDWGGAHVAALAAQDAVDALLDRVG
jgi:monoamine oxidase